MDPLILGDLTQAAVEGLPLLPAQSPAIPNGRYAIKHADQDSIKASDINVHTKIWFKSPPLDAQTIHKIRGAKLFAESYEQVDEQALINNDRDNWTWLELAILENESATSPKRDQYGNELVFDSHKGNISLNEFKWLQGEAFNRGSEPLRSLENGYLIIEISDDNDPVPITPIPVDGETPARRSVKEWYQEAQSPNLEALELSLFIKAMIKFQQLPPDDQLSYFRIAGIHGYPKNVSWNMGRDPIPRDSQEMETRIRNREGGFYCPHNKYIFPTWHRAYMMLFELRIHNLMMEEAEKSSNGVWKLAAKRWRLPYWDWVTEPSLPELARNEKITIIDSWQEDSRPQMKDVMNPMYRFRMPGDRPMGDRSYGDYRIDGTGDEPVRIMITTPKGHKLNNRANSDAQWDLCIGTSRHGISYYDEKRRWVQGHSDAERIKISLKDSLQLPGDPPGKITLKDSVFRLLTHPYSTVYEHFASTRHKPTEGDPNAKGYLSLELIHNNVHNFIGGTKYAAGFGHMMSVPVAAFDPIFWLHHCNVDRLFHLWQCVNEESWFKQGGDKDDNEETNLVPFHRSNNMEDFFNSNGVRHEEHYTYYTYDYMEQITENGKISPKKRNEYINKLYGPVSTSYESPTEDVDPIINVVYDRYAFNGRSYTLHFFLGSIEHNTPYHQQRSLVGSIYTFSASFTTPQGTTGCSSCREQASNRVLSHAQIPLTRSVPIQQRADNGMAMEHFRQNLRWVAVLDTGSQIPRSALGQGFSVELLLGRNQLKDMDELPEFSGYTPQNFNWDDAEL